jgi:hypothetical protein
MVTGRQAARRFDSKRSFPMRRLFRTVRNFVFQIRRDRTMPMPPMLAYTIRSTFADQASPSLIIDVGRNQTKIMPASPVPGSYWFVFLDRMNPRVKVKEWVVHGSQHSTVPPGIDTFMNDTKYIFAIATQSLPITWVPQGPLYDFFAKYGASRELQRLEQFNATIPCGGLNTLSYVLTSQAGPREPGKPAPPSYEAGSLEELPAVLMMSLMAAQESGGGPYSIMDAYTWTSP